MNLPITIATFYGYVKLEAPLSLRAPVLETMLELGIRGTVTLAPEGINATVSGTSGAIGQLMKFLKDKISSNGFLYRESSFGTQPFQRTKVKVKRELISLGVPAFPSQCVGRYVAPAQWNSLITQPDILTIDTRNDYEYTLGHFSGAVNPGTRNFKQMVAWTEANLDKKIHSRIAMYCTGGIRCEKYSSYLVSLGFAEIYHLRGGILAYLDHIPASESLWRGSCFVFDERISVSHGLKAF